MKKIFTLITLVLCTINTLANDYTDKLTVTVNGVAMEQQATITITQEEDGTYTFSLNNFCLESEEDDGSITRVGVGNIVLANREGTDADGVKTITYNDAIDITSGDSPDIDFWMGPMLGPVPIELNARFNDTQLYCEIHIDLMEMMGQIIDVVFGKEPEPDSIHVLYGEPTKKDGDAVYDLQGRKVSSIARHTIYIVNGKKVVKE